MYQKECKIVSIIIPVYYNESSLENLYSVLDNKIISQNVSLGFEVVFIDDGSGDNSFEILKKIKNEHHDTVKLIKLTRNFGQVNAIMAGLGHCKGDVTVAMSADLQDPPELIQAMLDKILYEDVDIVIATRKDRDESKYRVYTSRLFYWLMQKMSFKMMPSGGFDYFMITKRVLKHLIEKTEANLFLQGHILYTGFKMDFIPYTRNKRVNGSSKWTFSMKLKMLLDGILSYSYLPIRIMTAVGIITSFAGFIYAIVILIMFFTGGTPFKGWAPIMILILILSGLQMIMIGIIGEYLWRTLDQVRGRSQYVIDKIYD